MEQTAKDKVLMAIYNEYQKDIPNMDSISAQSLSVELEAFGVAIEKLVNEDLIRLHSSLDDSVKRGGLGSKVLFVNIRGTMVTIRGIHYVEERLLEPKRDSF